jgi:hypothetical protein
LLVGPARGEALAAEGAAAVLNFSSSKEAADKIVADVTRRAEATSAAKT